MSHDVHAPEPASLAGQPEPFLQYALEPMAFHGTARLACYGHAKTRLGRSVPAQEQNDQPPMALSTFAVTGLKLWVPSEPVTRAKPLSTLGQTAIRLRPLRRRALSTARPPRVFIRVKKPWVLWRRRLLGWNVRFTMYSSQCEQ
jgi:hypothetical protein